MMFAASRMFGLFLVVIAIGVVVALWAQCGSNGCSFIPQQKIVATPTSTPVAEFGTNEIHVAGIMQGDSIQSPVIITGEAIPDWYIGGSFTVRLLDSAGHGLAYAQAKPSDPTPVNGFIPFTVSFAFFPNTPTGTVLFEKNLGSGLPDFPTTVALPVSFPNYTQATATPEPVISPTPTPTPSATPVSTGTLKGTMTIGPICPVQQSGKTCASSVKMFADRPITVSKTDQAMAPITIIPGPTGEFSQELAPGQYYVSMVPQIMGSITGVPTTIKITAGKTTTMNISVDTGIRTPENTDTASSDGF
ncbi:MAG TPA: hypothetical protein VLG69_03190 [Candidatus Andersenbacteria bacterium]|nr:hypothetical protein [Candidatus Andersenbacteria bacterium]